MPKAADWRASEVEIVDGEFVRPQGSGANPSASGEETIEWIAWLMDRSIPIGGMRVGLDPILGADPGARRRVQFVNFDGHYHARASRRCAEGDSAADDGERGNRYGGGGSAAGRGRIRFRVESELENLELYRTAVRGERRAGKDWGFLALVMVGLFVLVAVPIFLAIWMFRALF
jgi:hypothetical protein